MSRSTSYAHSFHPPSPCGPRVPSSNYGSVLTLRFPHHSQQKEKKPDDGQDYQASLEELDILIESVQDFWRYNNNTPVDQIKMRESIYLFKKGFKPIWEDRRNLLGGSWTFRVGKNIGPDFWTRVQLMAIGEQLQAALDEGKRPLVLFPCFSSLPTKTIVQPTN